MTTRPSVECFVRSFDSGRAVGIVGLSTSVFGQATRSDVLHRAVLYETAWRSQNTEAAKQLGQVRGSTRKPFPQKGRGKARVGTLRAAHFVGGYAVHGPTPGARLPDIQTKVYDAAIRSALSTKFLQNQLIVVDNLHLESDSKQSLLDRLEALGISGRKSYFLYGSQEPLVPLTRAADKFTAKPKSHDGFKGEKKLLVTSADLISVLPVLENEFLVVDTAAIELLEELYLVN
ncbi:UNVERIFIED_CONTAM: 54S ribosomal protein L4 mitochondrial [Siphonaria sp. JEL0065]|nr:54S ribosomal protein L4 mitochondrial [Siphonaria sp. JEL0065]